MIIYYIALRETGDESYSFAYAITHPYVRRRKIGGVIAAPNINAHVFTMRFFIRSHSLHLPTTSIEKKKEKTKRIWCVFVCCWQFSYVKRAPFAQKRSSLHHLSFRKEICAFFSRLNSFHHFFGFAAATKTSFRIYKKIADNIIALSTSITYENKSVKKLFYIWNDGKRVYFGPKIRNIKWNNDSKPKDDATNNNSTKKNNAEKNNNKRRNFTVLRGKLKII